MKKTLLITILLNLIFSDLAFSQREKMPESINTTFADKSNHFQLLKSRNQSKAHNYEDLFSQKGSYLSPDIIGRNTPLPIKLRSLEDEELWTLDTLITSCVMGESDFAHIRYVPKFDEHGNRVKLTIEESRNENPLFDELSGDWKVTNDFLYFYNSNKQIDSMLFYSKYNGENLELTYKTSYGYDNKGINNEITSVMTEVAKANGMYSFKISYTDDENGNMLSELFYREDGNGGWKISYADYFKYDENNNMIKEERYEDGNAEVYYVLDYTYDERNNLINTLYFFAEEDRRYVESYSYDMTDNLLTKKVVEVNNALAVLDSMERSENFYNIDGLLEEEICYYWNNAQERYLVYHNHLTYDENNVLISVFEEETNAWYAGLREMTYDEEYNILEEKRSTKRPEDEDWILFDRIFWEYDQYKNCIESKNIRLFVGATEWAPWGGSHLYTYNNGKSQSTVGTNVWRAVYSYLKFGPATSNDNIIKQSESVKVFPNPVTDVAFITLNLDYVVSVKIRLFDLAGNLIYQTVDPNCGEGVTTKPIYMNNLSRGTYVVHILIGNKTVSKKIIKR